MDLRDCRFDGKGHFSIKDAPTDTHADKSLRDEYATRTETNNARMALLQDRLYADGREGIVVILQAMDAAGKDSTIKHVMSGVNPQGVDVYAFKQPTHEELAHDYLWRAARHLPARGKIALFNRSYYEDVLVVRVHGLWKDYQMPHRCIDVSETEFFDRRFSQIRDFEEHLYDNGYRVLKIFLNVSADTQRKRFLERIDDEAKNWKFSAADVAERALWPSYQKAFEDAIDKTATEHAPWYVIPADQKWVAHWLVSEAIIGVLEDCNPHYPTLPDDQRSQLVRYKDELTGGTSETR